MKSKLLQFLDSTHTSGEYVTQFVTRNPVNPGVYLEGFGLVALPISDQVSRSLLDHAQTIGASSGEGVAVFGSESIKPTNPEWTVALESIPTKLCEILYPGARCALTDPKLFLSMGSMDLDRELKSSQRNDLLGGFLVTLPSTHNGVTIEFASTAAQKTISVSPQQRFSSLEAAWLHDMHSQLVIAEQGCFAALLFEMVSCQHELGAGKSQLSAATQVSRQLEHIRKILDWFVTPGQIPEPLKCLAYNLSRSYPGQRAPYPSAGRP